MSPKPERPKIEKAPSDLLLRVDDSGTFLEARPGSEVPFAIPPQDFLGKNLADVLPPTIAEPAQTAISAALADNLAHQFEYQIDLPAGKGYFEARTIAVAENEVVITIRNRTRER
nr:PAS domain-containing protein [Actinomycetes bacterium]